MGGHERASDQAVIRRNSRWDYRVNKNTFIVETVPHLEGSHHITDMKRYNRSTGFSGVETHLLECFQHVVRIVPQSFDSFWFFSHKSESFENTSGRCGR